MSTLTEDEQFPWPWWRQLLFCRHRTLRPVYHSYECARCGRMFYD